MGVKGTDDYLTARAANPRTGLISPSVLTDLTPRTPLSPGEALSLYGKVHTHSHSRSPISESSPRPSDRSCSPIDRPRPAGPRGRWRQNEKGWIMETVSEMASPRSHTPASSISHHDFHANEDKFVIPMPTAKDPQPYPEKDHFPQPEAHIGLNGRMHSIGAGPRKFAEATKALRNHNSPPYSGVGEDTLKSQTQALVQSQKPSTMAEDAPLAKLSGRFSSPNPSIKSTTSQDSNPLRIFRRPVNTRRDSVLSMETSASSHEKEVYFSRSPSPEDNMHPNSNTSRFQDLRQLPRVRIVHPENSPIQEKTSSCSKRVFTLPESNHTPPPPYPTKQRTSSSSSTTSITPSLSPLETQIMRFLAWTITQLFPQQPIHPSHPSHSNPTTKSKPTHQPSPTILQAIHTLSDTETKPLARYQAGKVLLLAALRTLIVLGILVAVLRVGVAVGRILQVVFWPVGMVLAVLRWLLGLR